MFDCLLVYTRVHGLPTGRKFHLLFSLTAWHPLKFWISLPAPEDFEIHNTNWYLLSSFYVTSGTVSFKFLTQTLSIETLEKSGKLWMNGTACSRRKYHFSRAALIQFKRVTKIWGPEHYGVKSFLHQYFQDLWYQFLHFFVAQKFRDHEYLVKFRWTIISLVFQPIMSCLLLPETFSVGF